MDEDKKKKLKDAGWKTGSASEFLLDKIYLLTSSPYLECALPGFATNEDELAKIASNYFCDMYYCEPETISVKVHLDTGKVILTDPDMDSWIYTIHTIERVK